MFLMHWVWYLWNNISRRERHAKTIEIAQEEVLTCLGICVYERLHRIQLRIREEQYTCQVLAAAAIDGLARRFELLFFFFNYKMNYFIIKCFIDCHWN